jgi:hypothetical protein
VYALQGDGQGKGRPGGSRLDLHPREASGVSGRGASYADVASGLCTFWMPASRFEAPEPAPATPGAGGRKPVPRGNGAHIFWGKR